MRMGPLKMVDPEMALSRYEGDQGRRLRQALLTVFHITNKGLAHITADLAAPSGTRKTARRSLAEGSRPL